MRNLQVDAGNYEVEKCCKKGSYEKVNILLFLSIFLGLLGIGYLVIFQQVTLNDAKTKICELSLKVSDLQKNETDQRNRLGGMDERSLSAQIDVKIREKLHASDNNIKKFDAITEEQQKMKALTEESTLSLMEELKKQVGNLSDNVSSALSKVEKELAHRDGQALELADRLNNITRTLDTVVGKHLTMEEHQIKENDNASSLAVELVKMLDNITESLNGVANKQETLMKKQIDEISSARHITKSELPVTEGIMNDLRRKVEHGPILQQYEFYDDDQYQSDDDQYQSGR